MKRRNQYKRRTKAAAAAAEEEDNSNDSSTTDQSNDLLSDTADDSLLMPPPPSNKRKGGDTTTDIDTQGIIGSSTEPISNTTAKKKKTSLFSAVISRSSSNKSKSNNAHNKKQSIATSTKPSSLATATSNKMSTPTKKSLTKNNTKSTKKSPMHSPGGYEILQALDNANLYNDQQDNEGEEDGTTTARQHTKDTEGKDEFHDANVYFTKSTATSSTISRRGYDNMDIREKKRETKEDLSSLFLDSSIVEATRHGIDDFNTLKKGCSNINDVPNSVGMIDWSIKRRLRLDCIPGNCLPGGLKGGLNEGKVRQLAMQQLSSGGDTDSVNGRSSYSHSMRATEEEMAASKWLASTMYYQHPAVHPLPSSMLVDSSSSSCSTLGKMGDGGKGKEGKGDLSSYILQPQSVHNKVRLSGVGSMGGLGLSNLPSTNDKDKSILGTNQQRRERNDKSSVSTVSSLLYQRRRDWQECFRSLFQLWKSKLKDIDTSTTTPTSSQQDVISRNSFYIISSNQIVLFRCGYMKQHSGDLSPQLVPMVIFSSTTPYLRSKLKSMGVELRLFTSKRGDTTSSTATEEEGSYEVFSESLLQTNDDATPTQEDSAEVHAELNAIKHADDEKGKVTVEVKKRKVRPRYNDPNNSISGSKGSSLPPLFVYGIDDCNVVYELFMNTYGLSSVDNQSAGMSKSTTTNASPPVSDVPLLLCRSLGSNCLHTTLRTLSVSSRRDTGFMNQVYHQDQHQLHNSSATASNAKATLELRGPILPCALRDLTCAAINLMLLDKKSRQLGKHQDSDYFLQTNKNDNTETSSSHQFAMFLQVHEGESSTSMSKMTTGSSSSVNFNGSNISLMPRQEEGEEDDMVDHNDDTSSWYECRQGDCINVLVWDVSRTSVVSFHPTEA